MPAMSRASLPTSTRRASSSSRAPGPGSGASSTMIRRLEAEWWTPDSSPGPFDNPKDLVAEEVQVKASGWGDGALVHHSQERPRARRQPVLCSWTVTAPMAFPRLRASAPRVWPGTSRAGSSPWPTSAAEGSTAKTGTGGSRQNKPNTWRDGIACAEWLIAHGYTSPARMAIQGSSAGGIFVGRAITERPDLFAAAIDASPLSDMIRSSPPPGRAEHTGVRVHHPEDGFKGLFEMSPYHKVVDSPGIRLCW